MRNVIPPHPPMTEATAAAIPIYAAQAGRGVDWITEGYALFRRAPGTWIGILATWLLLSLVLAALKVQLLMSFLDPIFSAGIILGSRDLASGGPLRVGHLFEAFRGNRVGSLLMVVLIQLGLALLIGAIALVAVIVTMHGPFDLSTLERLSRLDSGVVEVVPILLGVLLVLILGLPLMMLAWFAPALIILRGVPAWEAMKLSLQGCLQNWRPFSLYGLVGIALLLVAALPLLLGLLVAIPVLAASVYTSYRDIYPEAPLSP